MMTRLDVDPARALLNEGVAARAFPAAAVEVGTDRQVLWREAFGALFYDPSAPATTPDTIFDLARSQGHRHHVARNASG